MGKRVISKKGFTLVELLVVLVVIGILVALILPNTFKAIDQANSRACASNLRTIDTAIRLCYADTRNWGTCESFAYLAGANPTQTKYMESLATCPVNATINYSFNTVDHTSNKIPHFPNWPSIATHQP